MLQNVLWFCVFVRRFDVISFGITPTMEKLYHKGVMRTTVDDCQFVCIAQNDYYKILHQVRHHVTVPQ